MIQLIGLKENNSIEDREKFAILEQDLPRVYKSILEFSKEVIIICTCNRTEIYFDSEDENAIDRIFQAVGWKNNLKEKIFYLKGQEAARHLMEVSCGFHSKILGEDQILGQIKKAYCFALENKSINKELMKLFQISITCGKEFKLKCKLNKVPVSLSSLTADLCKKKGFKRVLLIGYGKVGSKTTKYLLGSEIQKLYIGVRNLSSVNIKDERAQAIDFKYISKYYSKVDAIISCTSSNIPVVLKNEIGEGKISIFDLAMPRDVEESIGDMEGKEVYHIDILSAMDNDNKEKRKEIMIKNKDIIKKYLEEYKLWEEISYIVPDIKRIKNTSEKICDERCKTFKNKKETKDNDKLVEKLIKSTSNIYVNRAIEVLKEEQLKGRGEDCKRILEKIFFQEI